VADSRLSRFIRRAGIVVALTVPSWQIATSHAQQAATKPQLTAATRETMVANWSQQRDVLARTTATVEEKLIAAQKLRTVRAQATAALLRDAKMPRTLVNDEHAMNIARRRAAAKLLLMRERAEVSILALERDSLASVRASVEAGLAVAKTVTLPSKLIWPAEGTVARAFGTLPHVRSKTILARRGIDIEVAERAMARNPARGTVVFTGAIRGLDLGVIIDHGNYLTVIAKLGKLVVERGDELEAGTTIGKAAQSRVYFEVRVKTAEATTPIDPLAALN
jgi:septal ring factor EnvC (AmiA/AmiB activator)